MLMSRASNGVPTPVALLVAPHPSPRTPPEWSRPRRQGKRSLCSRVTSTSFSKYPCKWNSRLGVAVGPATEPVRQLVATAEAILDESLRRVVTLLGVLVAELAAADLHVHVASTRHVLELLSRASLPLSEGLHRPLHLLLVVLLLLVLLGLELLVLGRGEAVRDVGHVGDGALRRAAHDGELAGGRHEGHAGGGEGGEDDGTELHCSELGDEHAFG
mmetsp:Transcript_71564/g.202173  ORF Transcript_71564/g.202173 Transcript_71564/m.202173 type:complete len:216 (+) Transcript_71564:378-1025(+)